MASFTPFASAYGPVDALATRQMQINAAEQARQIEMARMQQAREAQMTQAMLQQKQLQDNQAAREMQAALSFRQQAEVEAHNRAVLGDAAATRNAQLVWNQKDLDARERMQGKQLESAENIAKLPRYDAKSLEVRALEQISERDRVDKSNAAAAAANARLEKALHEDVKTDKATWQWFGWFGAGLNKDEQSRAYILHKDNQPDVLLRKQRLAKSIPGELQPELSGLTKWDGTQFVPVGTTTSAGGARAFQSERPAGLSSVGPFDGFQVSFDGPVIPPAANAPVIVAPRISAPPVRPQAAPFIFNASPYGIGGMTAPPPSIRRSVDGTVYTPKNRAEYEAVPDGARFVNPSDGKTYTKKSSAK